MSLDNAKATLFPTKRISLPLSDFLKSLFPKKEVEDVLSFVGEAPFLTDVPDGPLPKKRRILVLGKAEIIAPYLYILAAKKDAFNLEVIAFEVKELPEELLSLGVRLAKSETSIPQDDMETYAYVFKKGYTAQIDKVFNRIVRRCPQLISFEIESPGESTVKDRPHRKYANKINADKLVSKKGGFGFWSRNSEAVDPTLDEANCHAVLGSCINDAIAMSFLDVIFENGLFDEKFFFDGCLEDDLCEDIFRVLCSSIGSPTDQTKDIKVYLGGELNSEEDYSEQFSSGRPFNFLLPRVKEKGDYHAFEGGVLVSVAETAADVLNSLEWTLKREKDFKAIIVVTNETSILSFLEGPLSELFHCPVFVISAFSAFPCPNFSFDKEYALRRNLAHRAIMAKECPSRVSYPIDDQAIWGVYLPTYRLYTFEWANYSTIYSFYPFLKAVQEEGDLRSALFPDGGDYLLEKIVRGERINIASLYWEIASHYSKKNSLIYLFGNYEHIQWARRTILFHDNFSAKDDELVAFDTLIRKVSFPDLLEKKARSSEIITKIKEDDAFLDYATFFDFLSRICSDFEIKESKEELRNLSKEPFETLEIPEERLPYLQPSSTEAFISIASIDTLGKVPHVGSLIKVGEVSYLVLESIFVPTLAFAKFAMMMEEGSDSSSVAPEVPLERSIIGQNPMYVLLRLLVLPDVLPKDPKRVSTLLVAPYLAAFVPHSREFEILKLRLNLRYELGKKALDLALAPITESTFLLNSPFVESLDPRGITAYHIQMGYYYDLYGEVGIDVGAVMIDASRAIRRSEFEYPYDDKFLFFGNVQGGMGEKIGHLTLPFPVPDYSFAHLLSVVFRVLEEEAIKILDGNLMFSSKALEEGKLVLGKGSAYVSFFDAFENILPILAGKKGDFAKEVYGEFASYPYGDNSDRLLFHRMAKIGLVRRSSFYHSYVPISSKLRNDFIRRNPFLGTYGESVLGLCHEIDDLERGIGNKNTPKAIKNFANECFKTIYYVHYISYSTLEAEKAVYPPCKRFAGILRAIKGMDKKEALSLIASRIDRCKTIGNFPYEVNKEDFILMAGYLEISSQRKIDSVYKDAAYTPMVFLGEIPGPVELRYSGLRHTLFRLSPYIESDNPYQLVEEYSKEAVIEELEERETIEWRPFEDVPAASFLVKYRLEFRRSVYFILYPVNDLPWIKRDQCLFAYIKDGVDGYHLVENKEDIETLYEKACEILKGADYDADDEDDDW